MPQNTIHQEQERLQKLSRGLKISQIAWKVADIIQKRNSERGSRHPFDTFVARSYDEPVTCGRLVIRPNVEVQGDDFYRSISYRGFSIDYEGQQVYRETRVTDSNETTINRFAEGGWTNELAKWHRHLIRSEKIRAFLRHPGSIFNA
jgi:hypothetical protein